MQHARNGARMDEDPMGLHHRVAGGPVGYRHRMRGEAWGLGGDRMPQRAEGHCRVANAAEQGKKGRKHQATALLEWETSRHGVGNRGQTTGNVATASWKKAVNPGTAMRCLQEWGLTLRPPGQGPHHT